MTAIELDWLLLRWAVLPGVALWLVISLGIAARARGLGPVLAYLGSRLLWWFCLTLLLGMALYAYGPGPR